MASNSTCPRCGSDHLEPGDLIVAFDNTPVLFRPHAKRFFTRRSGVEVTTVVCMDCGSLQMQADVQAVAGMLKPEKEPSSEALNSAEPIECLGCGATIDAEESKCSKCGWTYTS